MTCPICQSEVHTLRSGIKNDQYISERCDTCFNNNIRISMYARKYNRDRGREDFRKDIIQRFEGDKINEEFIRAYPEQSKQEFGEDVMRGYGERRKLI